MGTATRERTMPTVDEDIRQLLTSVALRDRLKTTPLGVFALEEFRGRFRGAEDVLKSTPDRLREAKEVVQYLYLGADPDQREFVDYQLGEVVRVMNHLMGRFPGDGGLAAEIYGAMESSRNTNDLRLKLGKISLDRNPKAKAMLAELDAATEENRRIASVVKPNEGEVKAMKVLKRELKDVKKLAAVDEAAAKAKAESPGPQAEKKVDESLALAKAIIAGGDTKALKEVQAAISKSKSAGELRARLGVLAVGYAPEMLLVLMEHREEALRRKKA